MERITNTIQNKFYTYVPGEFLPIFEGGTLANRDEFYKYKAKRMMSHVGKGAYRALEAFDGLVKNINSR